MDSLVLLSRASAAGLKVTVEGENLVIRGPKSAAPLVQELFAQKKDVLQTLASLPKNLPPEWHYLWDERAAIMEYDGGLLREQAEAEALTMVLRLMATSQVRQSA